jgi:hypothetical protein
MYMLNQETANLIAERQMDSDEMRTLFAATEAQAREIESAMQAEFFKETGDRQVAVAATAFLPILVENAAISRYISSSGNYALRMQTPEIITAEEAGLFAELEYSLNQDQINTFVGIIKSRWALLSGIRSETGDLLITH